MNISLMFTAILVHLLLRRLEATSNTRVLSLPLQFGFDPQKISHSSVASHNKTVVCMLDSWSHWRDHGGQFKISDIDPTLCSQLVYRNAGIDNNTFQVKIRDNNLAESLSWYRQTVALSRAHPHLKVLLSIGGWTEGSASFSKIAADYEKRSIFVDSVIRVLQKYGFHGLDLAWEFPAWINRGGTHQDKENLPLLMQDLRQALGKEYIISLTVAGDTHFASPAYKIKALANFVDQFNVRPFDFSGAWNNYAYHHSALKDKESMQSVMSTVNFYLENGAPPEKLIVGIPFYARSFLLKEEASASQSGNNSVFNMSGLGQPTLGGFSGSWIDDKLMIGYHEICHTVSSREGRKDWETYWDNFCMVPFARHNRRWVTFDNPESIEAKVSFVLRNNLKGVMAWTIDTDDFAGTNCMTDNEDQYEMKVTYPLLRTINFALLGDEGERRLRSESRGPLHSGDSISGRGSGDIYGENNIEHDFGKKGKDSRNQQGKGSSSRCRENFKFLFWSYFLVMIRY